MHCFLIGIMLILFWIVPTSVEMRKPHFIVKFLQNLYSPFTLRIVRLLSDAMTQVSVLTKDRAIESICSLLGVGSGTAQWIAGAVVGVIYFGGMIIIRHNPKKRDMVCKKCHAHNRFSYFY